MLTAIVADDEKIARRRLVRLIEETGEAEVVAACAGGREAVEQTTRAAAATCSFSTCRCRTSTASACCESSPARRRPATVFVTAFDQYAVRAFDVHAVDYLLKPFDTARFREAFARAKDRAARRDARARTTSAFARCSPTTSRHTQATASQATARSRRRQGRRRAQDRAHRGRRLVGDRRQLHPPARRRRRAI